MLPLCLRKNNAVRLRFFFITHVPATAWPLHSKPRFSHDTREKKPRPSRGWNGYGQTYKAPSHSDLAFNHIMPTHDSLATKPLGDMPPEEFRRYGHQLVDWIADFLTHIDEHPVSSAIKPDELRAQLPKAPPQTGEPMHEILADVDRLIMPAMTHWNHPEFFAYFVSSGSGPGILAEMLSATLNPNAMLWKSCPAATELEQVTLDWLREMMGLPKDFWGIMYDTASISIMHALAAAREQLADLQLREHGMAGRKDLPRLRVYASEHAHSSIDKAALILGIGKTGVRKIAVDERFRMRPEALQRALNEDRAAGWRPVCVVATVGTTSMTSIDPVAAIAKICERENVWLHVDAAYGGSAAIVPSCAGCSKAASLPTLSSSIRTNGCSCRWI